jgi:hypothetical protein
MFLKKVTDRLNLLKILSYDRNMRLDTKLLVKMYKTLARSVLDYASILISSSSNETYGAFEVIQNDSLRIIFKKSSPDKISVEELREMAKIESIKDRHIRLLDRYSENALVTHNGFAVSKNLPSWNLCGRQIVSGPISLDSSYKNRLVANFPALEDQF